MDKQQIKNILEKEIKFHSREIGEHKRLAEIRISKTQKLKAIKHFHKKFQTIKIAKELGFEFCEKCGGLRLR